MTRARHRTRGLGSCAALVKRLQSEISLQETLASIEDHVRFSRSDELFHQYIAEAVGFEGVWTEIGNAKLHMNMFRALTFPSLDSLALIIRQHQAITSAVAAGRQDEAVEAMHEHLRKIFPLMPALLEKHPEYFETESMDVNKRIYRPDISEVMRS